MTMWFDNNNSRQLREEVRQRMEAKLAMGMLTVTIQNQSMAKGVAIVSITC